METEEFVLKKAKHSVVPGRMSDYEIWKKTEDVPVGVIHFTKEGVDIISNLFPDNLETVVKINKDSSKKTISINLLQNFQSENTPE